MICYQDEKTYGLLSDYEKLSVEELDEKIKELEIKIYGHTIDESAGPVESKIYDVEKKQFVSVG